ncbi:MAG TPA: PEGA domain-containing protein [Methanoregulaceae archaeon]|nr:PEGA domain-containing protein [Methanoregulaceae archaeon]
MKSRSFIISLVILVAIFSCGITSAQMVGEPGSYQISSDPSGAQVTFDGEGRGSTPVNVEISSSGTPGHTLRITKDGYEPYEQSIPGNPPAGQTVPIFAQLQPIITIPPTTVGGDQGYFSIRSTPSGADVTFDGKHVGETPVTVPVYTTSSPSHTVTIYLPGYESWTRTYNENPGKGETITVQADLVPTAQTGSIYVTSQPSGATATLDGKDSYSTPCSFPVVSVGTHSLTVYLSGYQPYYASPNVRAKQTTTISAVLTPVSSTGNLQVSSSPSGAAVYVDGNYYGHTPTTVGNLAPGSHSVSLRLSGYQEWAGTVTINAGQTTSISPTLTAAPTSGSISVTSNPSGAMIYLDGTYQGKTLVSNPFYIISVQPGSHVLEISLQGYQDYTSTISVNAGQTTPVSVTLNRNPQPPSSGTISVSSSPSGAEVYLDNVFRGYSPQTIQDVASGSHVVLMKLGGYQDWQSTVQVSAGQDTPVNAIFTPTPTTGPTKAGSVPFLALAAIGAAALLLWRRTS